MSRIAVLVVGMSFLLAACDDPKDAKTWIKKLRNPEHATEAVRQLQKIGDPAALQPLFDLYRDFESPNILKAIISFKDKRAIPTLAKALEFSEESKYHNATLAAAALADLKAVEAIDALGKLLEQPMAIKSRANKAKVAAIEAMARLGDRKAVPHLIRALAKKPEEQDFFINKRAAWALGELGDPAAAPILVEALFMASTVQGACYPMARVALVKVGKPAVQPLLDAFQGKNEKLNAMGKALDFGEGVIRQKTAWVLGDMMAKEAAPVLLEAFNKAKLDSEEVNGLDGIIEALAKIGDPSAEEPLVKGLANPKANYKIRMQICQAVTVMGARKSLPVLIEVMKKGYLEDDATNLVENAAMAFGRVVGSEAAKYRPEIEAIMKNPKLSAGETQNLFKEVLERMEVAVECKDDPLCYGKKVTDEKLSLVKREKSGIMIGTLPDGVKALPDLMKALPIREPVLRLYYLQAARRIGSAKHTELIELLKSLAEKDSKRTVQALGADLTSEDLVTLAVVKNK